MNQYRCETCKNRKTIYGEYACEVVSRKMTKCFYEWVTKVGCASHSDFQCERDAHWRDLFVSDLRSSIKWDAEHGNPELFKVVVTLDKHYNTFSVEQHDKQVRDKVLDEVIAKWREWHHAGYERPIQRETVVKLFEELRQAGSP